MTATIVGYFAIGLVLALAMSIYAHYDDNDFGLLIVPMIFAWPIVATIVFLTLVINSLGEWIAQIIIRIQNR